MDFDRHDLEGSNELGGFDIHAFLAQHNVELGDYFAWRSAQDSDIKAIRDRASEEKLEEILTLSQPFVVIQAISNYQQLFAQRRLGIVATKKWLAENLPNQQCLVINNSGGHWDLTSLSASGQEDLIESSGADLACGCYTFMNVVIQYSAYADPNRLREALKKLLPEEQRQIESILRDPSKNSRELSPQLVRKFTQAAIEVLPTTGRVANDEVRQKSIEDVIKPNYQLATEEICLALDGLEISYVEQSALVDQIATNDQDLQQNVYANLVGANGEVSFQNEISRVCDYIVSTSPATSRDQLIEKVVRPNFSQQFLIPAQFIDYCKALGLGQEEIDGVNYFVFLNNDGTEVFIPTENKAESRIYFYNGSEDLDSDLSDDESSEQYNVEEYPVDQYHKISEDLLAALDLALKKDCKEYAADQDDATKSPPPSPKPKPRSSTTLDAVSLIKSAFENIASVAATSNRIEVAIEDKLEKQKGETAPTAPYRGIGVSAIVTEPVKGITALKIEDIFEESLARFFVNADTTAMSADDLKTKLAGKFIVAVNGQDINQLAINHGGKNKPQFLKAVVSLFHGAGNLEFEIVDKVNDPKSATKSPKTKIRCERNIFVAHTCDEVKNQLGDKKGAQYNPDIHGIEALSKKVTEVATAVLAEGHTK